MPDSYLVSFLNPTEPLFLTLWKRGKEYGYLSIGPDYQEQDVFKKNQNKGRERRMASLTSLTPDPCTSTVSPLTYVLPMEETCHYHKLIVVVSQY